MNELTGTLTISELDPYLQDIKKIDSAVGLSGYYKSLSLENQQDFGVRELLKWRRSDLSKPMKDRYYGK